MSISRSVLIFAACLLTICHQLVTVVLALECNDKGFVYGENGIVDELLTCSLSKSFDLDLTPNGDHSKSTARSLVEQGLNNRTSILHARLSGLWTARRPSFIETGWQCEGTRTTSTSVIELSNLSLEVVEKMEAPLARNQHRLSSHRPCKTFDLPIWMCRQSKPIYRTISTWVNRAYYNLTLVQSSDDAKPTSARLGSMFTCPETFKQRITYSPSSTHLLMRHSHTSRPASSNQNQPPKRQVRRELPSKNLNSKNKQNVDEIPSFGHASSFTTTQSSNMPASPLYQNSVRVIAHEVAKVLQSVIEECIETLDVDLNLLSDYKSFSEFKYNLEEESSEEDETFREGVHSGITNECSNKVWIKSRIELTNQVNFVDDSASLKSNPTKRNQIITLASQPEESGGVELLDPYGFYHDMSADQMID